MKSHWIKRIVRLLVLLFGVTELGLQIAEQIYEKHLFFTKQLILAGVDPETAEQDACGIEHAVSSESFQKLKKAFDDG